MAVPASAGSASFPTGPTPRPCVVVGRFPPPIDGQTMATQRLADLLADAYSVQRANVSPGTAGFVESAVRLRMGKVRHYAALRRRLRDTLNAAQGAPVLWTSISPAPLGHLRDRLVVLPAFRQDQPVYAVVHWGNFDRVFRAPATAASARRMARRLRGFVFLNEQLAERCASWIPSAQRFVIPNTVDAALCYADAEIAAKQARRRGRTVLRLLFLSNMIPSKGYFDVLDAVHLLHARDVPVEAVFAGGWESDADRKAFEAAVAAYGLTHRVTHLGSVSDRARIRALYLDADVFLLPTYYPTEAQPISVIEALSAATPVVTTQHASIPAMVREGQEALFVPPRAPEAIAAALERLAGDARWQHLSAGARARFQEAFSPAAVLTQWKTLLEHEFA
jgi:glycosyltransferase involved in cell wall biosynthesis